MQQHIIQNKMDLFPLFCGTMDAWTLKKKVQEQDRVLRLLHNSPVKLWYEVHFTHYLYTRKLGRIAKMYDAFNLLWL